MRDKTFNSWLAGFWEGEGSICKKKARYAYVVSIGQSLRSDRTIKKLFEKIQKNFGGYSYYERGTNIIKWQLTKRKDVINFIKAIYPYCHLRKKQLKKVLNNYEMHPIKSYKNVDIKNAERLRQKGKTYREIARILEETTTAVWRRLNQSKYEVYYKKYYQV